MQQKVSTRYADGSIPFHVSEIGLTLGSNGCVKQRYILMVPVLCVYLDILIESFMRRCRSS